MFEYFLAGGDKLYQLRSHASCKWKASGGRECLFGSSQTETRRSDYSEQFAEASEFARTKTEAQIARTRTSSNRKD